MPLYLKWGSGPDIKGEVTETKHKGWLAIDSIGFGTGRATHVEVGSGQEKRHRDQPTISDLQISRTVDTASPLLFNASVAGEPTEVTIHCLRPANKQNAPPLMYLELKLRNCLISSYSVGGGAGGASESLSLNFTAIDYYYTPYDDKDKAGETAKGFFDLVDAQCKPWSSPSS
jgi:type VI secretion system secreted protein Hcp